MSLTLEWKHRIDRWREELPRHFYRPLGIVDLSGFVTVDRLTPGEALWGEFEPMPPGTQWGAKWEYGWFRGEVVLPDAAVGKRIVLVVDVGAESAVFVDRVLAGAKDRFHREITLCRQGVPGTRYDVLVEGYAGHGPRVVHAGPTPPGRETVPEPGPTQATVGGSTFGVWEEDVYQLWADVETLYQIRENIDPNSLRVAEIDRALRDFTVIVDYELPQAEMLKTVHACRERLRPLLDCVNGSTVPTMFAFGHAHIDVAWLWPLAETERKVARTLATQLALMEEYPEYKFLQSQPHLYHMAKTRYPELYERIKAAVRAGQLIPEGSTWVEPDTNVPGGESLIRQFIYGKRFFQEEFGVECELLWLPDVFGYSGALPQIMRGCGIKYFSTQKIFWSYHGGDPFPYNTFIWEGIDGSEVFAHLHYDYNSPVDPASVIQRWNMRVQKDGFSTQLFPFGWGDGGGGPTRDHLEFARRQRNLEGVPRVRIASPVAYFEDQEAQGWPDVRYVGELYFQAHRGTYTSQARTKRGNRKSEIALREAEMWGSVAGVLGDFECPMETLREAWTAVLLNQFHDILPGSSIHRVYEEAEAAYDEVIRRVGEVARQAASAIIDAITDGSVALTVFNSLSWERTALISLPEGFDGAVSGAGSPLPVQILGGGFAEVAVPPCGWTTLHPGQGAEPGNLLKATDCLLENDCLQVVFNDKGEITDILDKETDRNLAAGLCSRLRMYKDVPSAWDAWDIESTYASAPVDLDEVAQIEVVSGGPLVAKLCITRWLHKSKMIQEVSLRRGSRRIDFRTVIDWQESHKLLKVDFPVNVHTPEAIHEIQFGHIRRPNHASRQFDADRFEVPAHRWTALAEENRGCAVLNDCKYGVNVLGNSIDLTLLKSALAPDMTADRGCQEFTYAFYAWNGSFADSDVVREAYDLNCPVLVVPGAGGERALFCVDAPNVIVESVKPAEDGSGDLILRLYESKRTATRCVLTTSLPIAAARQANMLEETEAELRCEGGEILLDFRAFEIKTLRLNLSISLLSNVV
ncbi:MAG: alpha-mannosidase [Anaerolineae bacterium]|nr:alpha-mannosidase [Anaerolineae bacterium]